MAVKAYPLAIKKVVKETADAISISFEIPAHLKSEFDYDPGQYLTLEVMVDDRKERRSYSLCSSPLLDHLHTVTVKRLEGGLVSNYLNDHCFEGMLVNVMPPMGEFIVDLNERQAKHYILIGGGSGITPLMSILKSVLDFETQSKVTLLYANRNVASIIYKNQLDEMEQHHQGRFKIIDVLSQPLDSWSGQRGRLDEEKLGDLLDFFGGGGDREYFLCGPNGLIDTALATLEKRGVAKEKIHKEYFVIQPKEGAATGSASSDRVVKIKFEGDTYETKVAAGTVILDAAIDADIDPPYACKAAACCACRAKLVSGKVEMDDREILTDEEIAAGYILTCQAHPVTDDVVVDYDQ